ncbi:MAG: VWA domain-containing protein [bacterium]|nr:VWA domain-containing protein [bacterium]
MFQLHSPWLLLLLLLTPLFLERQTRRGLRNKLFPPKKGQQQQALLFASPPGLSKSKKSLVQLLRPWTLSLLNCLGFILLVIALARPQYGNGLVSSQEAGRDIMLTLDLSGSMRAMDFVIEGTRVDRLAALQNVVKKFINERPGDRFGVVIFADQAFTQCPLTNDGDAVNRYIDALQIGMAGQSTAIGDALAISIKRIRDIPGDSKTIILVTDGKNNAGSAQPLEVAKLAKKLHIRVHTIGIGGNKPAPFPVQGMFGMTRYVNRVIEFDEETLRGIAEATDGEYFHAENLDELQHVYQQIDQLEERKEEKSIYVIWEEHFDRYLLWGLVAMALAEVLNLTAMKLVRLEEE